MPPKIVTPPIDNGPAAVQQRAHTTSMADFELPKTTLTKLAKGSTDGDLLLIKWIPDNIKMQQDVVLALMRSSTLFISYLTAAAHDQALSRSGKSITATDVIKAIVDMDFGPADNLVPLLEQELAAFRANVQASKAKAKPAGPGRGRARKSNATTDVEMTSAGAGAEAEEDDGEVDESVGVS